MVNHIKSVIVFCTACLFFAQNSQAQQDAAYSMYMFNGLYLNPAYAGSHDLISISALYRHQWSGIDGAPRSASVGVHTPLIKNQHAIGLLLNSDRLGVTDMYSMSGSYAFRAKFTESLKLSVGMSIGFTQYSSDLTELLLPDAGIADASFAVNQRLFLPNFGFGAFLYDKKYYVGVSVPHLINNGLGSKLKKNASTDIAQQYNHWLVTGGYVFGKEGAKLKFKPSILMKYVKNAPIDFDLNASFLLNDRFWMGATYRVGGDRKRFGGDAIIAMFEFKATSALRVGYSYDFTTSSLGNYNNGTHELFLGYDFGFEKKRFVSPRYVKFF